MVIISKGCKPDKLESHGSLNLDDSFDSGNFSVRGYLPLIQKDSVTHMHSVAVYVKEDFLLHMIYL